MSRYVQELVKILQVSPSSPGQLFLSFSRRFGRTHNWRVALKCLLLLHSLLRSLRHHNPFRSELLCYRSNRLLSLNPCHFTDFSSSLSDDYTSFVRSYAHLLDEALISSFTLETAESDGESTPKDLPDQMKSVTRILEFLPQIHRVIDRVIDCRPTGEASRSLIVQSAMALIIPESFAYYTQFKREIVVIMDKLIEMPYRVSVDAFSIYRKAAIQADQLHDFYELCKSMTIWGPHEYEYPSVDRIPRIQIQALEKFLNGMWQMTDQSSSSWSSTTSTTSSSVRSPSTIAGDDSSDGDGAESEIDFSTKRSNVFGAIGRRKKIEKKEESEPLIKLEGNDDDDDDDDDHHHHHHDDESVCWETLLEDSIKSSCGASGSIGHGFEAASLRIGGRTAMDAVQCSLLLGSPRF